MIKITRANTYEYDPIPAHNTENIDQEDLNFPFADDFIDKMRDLITI